MTTKPMMLADKHPLSAIRSPGTYVVKDPAGSPPGTYFVEVFNALVDGVGVAYLRATNLSKHTQRFFIQSGAHLHEVSTSSGAGTGDMARAEYDPHSVGGDAFDMANMSEGETAKILTAEERAKLADIAPGADVTSAESVKNAGGLLRSETADALAEGKEHLFLTTKEREAIVLLARRAAANGVNKDITSLLGASKIAGGDKSNALLTVQQTTGNGVSGGIRFLVGPAGETEPLRFDVHGHVLIGAAEAHAVADVQAKLQLHGDMSLSQVEDNERSAAIRFFKSRGKYAVYPHDEIGGFEFHSDRGDGVAHRDAAVTAYADGKLSFRTAPDKLTAPTEALVIDGNGAVSFPRIGKTAASGNGSKMLRTVSAKEDMENVETLEAPWADGVLKLRPIWYRSAHDAGKSYYGLMAEEVAEIDERLVHWTYPDDAYETITEEVTESVPVMKRVPVKVERIVEIDGKAVLKVETVEKEVPETRRVPVFDEAGEAVFVIDEHTGKKVQVIAALPVMEVVTRQVTKRVLKKDAEMIPDGVMYDRLAVFLIHFAKKQRKEIETLAKRVSKTEAAVKVLSTPSDK